MVEPAVAVAEVQMELDSAPEARGKEHPVPDSPAVDADAEPPVAHTAAPSRDEAGVGRPGLAVGTTELQLGLAVTASEGLAI